MKRNKLITGATSIALAATMLTTPALAAAPTFSDVPSNHWAASSIATMAEKGIMKGMGNNLFAPENTITNAEFVTMIVRQFYSDKVGAGGDAWYTPYIVAAQESGCLAGTNVTTTPTATINRYDMAQIMYNVKQLTSSADTSKIADWSSVPTNYQQAVSACYSAGLLTGVDSAGTFAGETGMTRAQAAAVIDRLTGETTPTTPSDIPEGALILTGDNVTLKGYTVEMYPQYTRYENGKFILINTATNSCAAINFINEGYSTLTFTCTITADKWQRVCVAGRDGIIADGRLDTHQDPGTTKTYTVDISGIRDITLNSGNGSICTGAEITNIYLTK